MLLSSIYYGNVSPVEDAVPGSPEYRALGQKISKILETLKRTLSEEEMAEVDKLHTYISELYCYDCEEKFKFGLVMGIKLMEEVNSFQSVTRE